MAKVADYPAPDAALSPTDVVLGDAGGRTAAIPIALITAYVVSALYDTIGQSTSFDASIVLSPTAASVSAVLLAMSPAQRQTMRDAMALLDETSDVGLLAAHALIVQTSDAFGQFVGTTLFGGAADPQLATLFATASAATMLPFTYNLLPVSLGDVLTNA